MSKAKLHKVSVGADANNTPDGWFRIIPATTDEIMDAHPTCGDCKWCDVQMYIEGGGPVYECCPPDELDNIPMAGQRIFPATDYCRHWEKAE